MVLFKHIQALIECHVLIKNECIAQSLKGLETKIGPDFPIEGRCLFGIHCYDGWVI